MRIATVGLLLTLVQEALAQTTAGTPAAVAPAVVAPATPAATAAVPVAQPLAPGAATPAAATPAAVTPAAATPAAATPGATAAGATPQAAAGVTPAGVTPGAAAVAPQVAATPGGAAPAAAASPVAPAVTALPFATDLSQCGVTVAAGRWQQGVVREAVLSGTPNVSIPAKGAGFNRTVSLDGICQDSFSASVGWLCTSETGELRSTLNTTITPTAPVKLNFNGESCGLSGIAVYKTTKASKSGFQMEMRLEFDTCSGNDVSSAAVLVGIKEDPVPNLNILPWVREVCDHPVTPAPAVNVIKSKLEYTKLKVGDGKCDAEVRRELPDEASDKDCEDECVASTTKQHLLGKQGCQGYSYNPGGNPKCILYSGAVNKATGADDPGYICHNITYTGNSYAKSTPAPTTAAPIVSKTLTMKQAFGQADSAFLEEVYPPTDKPGCYRKMWWFRLEDRYSSEEMAVKVSQADWAELLATIPEPIESSQNVSAPQTIDRVLVNTCKHDARWATKCGIVTTVDKTKAACRNEEMTGAIISGVITSVLTWLMVAIWFIIYLRFGQTKTGYTQTAADESGQTGSRACTHPVFQVGMCVVAGGGALLACFISMRFLDTVMRSSDCYNFDEFLVVILAVVLSVALAIILFSLYMARSHPAHPHPILHNTGGVKGPRTNTKLMLVEVPDGSDMGNPLDSMIATKEDGRWTGFMTQGSNSPYNSFGGADPMRTGGSSAMASYPPRR